MSGAFKVEYKSSARKAPWTPSAVKILHQVIKEIMVAAKIGWWAIRRVIRGCHPPYWPPRRSIHAQGQYRPGRQEGSGSLTG